MFSALVVLTAAVLGQHLWAEQLDGTVGRIAAGVLLVETDDGPEVVTLADGATLEGAVDMLRISVGDAVRVIYSKQLAGVMLAEVLTVESEPFTEARYWVNIGELRQSLDGGPDLRRPVIIDARSGERFASGHIPGALSMPVEGSWQAYGLPEAKSNPLVFYSEGRRCGLAQAAVRRALDLGYFNARSLRGGLPTWILTAGVLELEVEDLAAATARSASEFLIVDLREEASTGETLPGAVHVPLEAALLQREAFLGEVWMPTFVLVGDDADDPGPRQAAEKIIAWRSTDASRRGVPVLVLNGGFEAWKAAGLPTVPLAAVPDSVRYWPEGDNERIGFDEFRDLWNNRSESEVLLVDVRSPLYQAEAGTVHIPLEQLHERASELPVDKEIVLFCEVGNRSAIAHLVLSRLGLMVRYLAASPRATR